MNETESLEQHIGYSFRDPMLLKLALTHRSASGEHMERLEFLGDAVLGLIVSEYLYSECHNADEGKLTRLRANLVRRSALIDIARQWQLAGHIQAGAGEIDSNGALISESILADVSEAVIGAVFQDGGLEAARQIVLSAWSKMLERLDILDRRDAKTRLQELTQARSWGLPEYRIEDQGQGVSPRFTASCFVQEEKCGEGKGDRKKVAESRAAEQAWKHLQGQ